MAATIMDGKALAAKVKEEVRQQTAQMGRKPGLAVVLVGDDPASRVYVNGKKRDCGECGIYSGRPPVCRRSAWSWWRP